MRATLAATRTRPTFGTPAVRLARFAFHHLFTFEAAFALFAYSNTIKALLPSLPADETLLFGLLTVAAGGIVILRQGIYVRGLPIVAAALVFIGWAVMSWAWTPSEIHAREILTFMFIFELPCLVLAALILASSRERTLRFLVLILAVTCGLAAFGWFIQLAYGSFRYYRGFGGFHRNYLVWGYAIAEGAIIAFALVVASRVFSRRQILAAALFGLCAGFLLVGSGRGPLLSVLLAVLLALLVGMPQLTRGQIRVPTWQLIALGLVFVGGIYVVYLVSAGVRFATFHHFTSLFRQLDQADQIIIEGGYNRFVTFAAAFKLWLQAPVIGNGVGSFSILQIGRERFGNYPHNIILELLSSLGIVGLTLFAAMLWVAWRQGGIRRLREDPLLLCIAMLLVGQLMSAMVRGDLGSHERLFLWLGLLALRPLPTRPETIGGSRDARPGRPARLRPVVGPAPAGRVPYASGVEPRGPRRRPS